MAHSHMVTFGAGGFFLAREDYGQKFDESFPTCAFFFLLLK